MDPGSRTPLRDEAADGLAVWPSGRLNWHLWIDSTPRPGFLHMAIDSALLALAGNDGVGFLRLYRWDPPCLSFGRHEPALRRYDRTRITALGLNTVRRPTGGRAVWHEAELTYAVAAPAGALGGLRESCARIHGMLRHALALLGVSATVAPAPEGPAPTGAGACFAAPAGGELLVDGRKVVGSAQLRSERATLQHGSLLLGGDQRRVAEVTVGGVASAPVATLADALGRPVGFAEAAEAVADAARAWGGGGTWRPVARGDAVLELAAAFADGYRSDAWTWCR
ncbi:MAG TPA: hypothetical protein VFU46_10670 [Gemmatimonadales bacterium]|nr:hypothetical protein [Gemmatimonadales bacterium]